MRTAVFDVAVDMALRGNLRALESLLDRCDGLPWVLQVLVQSESWMVRVTAAEMIGDYAFCTQLYHHELATFIRRMNELITDAKQLKLTDRARERILALDPERDLRFSDVPRHLRPWFRDTLAKVVQSQRNY